MIDNPHPNNRNYLPSKITLKLPVGLAMPKLGMVIKETPISNQY